MSFLKTQLFLEFFPWAEVKNYLLNSISLTFLFTFRKEYYVEFPNQLPTSPGNFNYISYFISMFLFCPWKSVNLAFSRCFPKTNVCLINHKCNDE